jgi:hypothetical protein
MKVKFFNQPYLLYVYEIEKVHGSRDDYLLLIYDTPKTIEEMVMVGKIKKENYNLITYTEVFLES